MPVDGIGMAARLPTTTVIAAGHSASASSPSSSCCVRCARSVLWSTDLRTGQTPGRHNRLQPTSPRLCPFVCGGRDRGDLRRDAGLVGDFEITGGVQVPRWPTTSSSCATLNWQRDAPRGVRARCTLCRPRQRIREYAIGPGARARSARYRHRPVARIARAPGRGRLLLSSPRREPCPEMAGEMVGAEINEVLALAPCWWHSWRPSVHACIRPTRHTPPLAAFPGDVVFHSRPGGNQPRTALPDTSLAHRAINVAEHLCFALRARRPSDAWHHACSSEAAMGRNSGMNLGIAAIDGLATCLFLPPPSWRWSIIDSPILAPRCGPTPPWPSHSWPSNVRRTPSSGRGKRLAGLTSTGVPERHCASSSPCCPALLVVTRRAGAAQSR